MLRRSPRFLWATMDTISPKVLKAEYAVRGPIVIRSLELKKQLQDAERDGVDSKLPFKKIISCNIGNPQELGQLPFTFHRQVLGLWAAPPEKVLSGELGRIFNKDAIERVRFYLSNLSNWTQTGAYTISKGLGFIRDTVAKYIENRDNTASGKDLGPVDPETLLLGNGASASVEFILSILIGGPQDGILIPIPQYPLYTAHLALKDGTPLEYYLDEETGWSMKVEDLVKCIDSAKKKGVKPRAMVVINPGNPTGQVLSYESLQNIVKFCYENELLLMADEVYQKNVYVDNKKFHSMREVLRQMPEPIRSKQQLISFHSVSKGIIGECGRRGGYMQLENIPNEVALQILKIASIGLCSNVDGQIMVELMLNPPKKGDESYEQYVREADANFASLKRRAQMIDGILNKIPGIKSNKVEGAMYAFPRLELPPKYIDHAVKCGRTPDSADAQWCLELLEQTGVVTVPGSGFGQLPGTLHFRTTILPPEDEIADVCVAFEKFQVGILEKYR